MKNVMSSLENGMLATGYLPGELPERCLDNVHNINNVTELQTQNLTWSTLSLVDRCESVLPHQQLGHELP